MLDWYHVAQRPEHKDAAVAALREAPARSVFCLGAGWATPASVESDIRRVRSQLTDNGLVTMAWGLRGADDTGMDTLAREIDLAAELGLRTSLHTGGDHRPVATMHERGLLRDTTTFVHGNGIGDDELRMLADAGSHLSVSPDVGLKMGFGAPLTGRALAAGLRLTLSIDVVPSVGGDIFSTMRTAFSAQRGLDGGLRARDLLHFATIDAARSCGLESRTRQHHPRQGRRPRPAAHRRPDCLPRHRPGRIDRHGRPPRHRRHGPRRRPRREARLRPGRRRPGPTQAAPARLPRPDRGSRRHPARRHLEPEAVTLIAPTEVSAGCGLGMVAVSGPGDIWPEKSRLAEPFAMCERGSGDPLDALPCADPRGDAQQV